MRKAPNTGRLLEKWRLGFLFFACLQSFYALAQEGWTSGCSAADPSVKEIMVTPCNSGGPSNNEYIVLKTGSASFNSKDLSVQVKDLSGLTTLISSFNKADPANIISRLRTAVGTCAIGVTFVDAHTIVGDVIPPYSTVLAFTGSNNLDVSYLSPASLAALCGSKVYVVFGAGPSNLFPDNGACGSNCLASVQFKFASASSVYCAQVKYDASKVKNQQGAFIDLQSDGSLFYGGAAGTCMPTAPLICPPAPPDPGFGNNAWNVLTYSQANNYTAAKYVGFYVADGAHPVTGLGCAAPAGSFEFNTASDGWTNTQAPSDAVNAKAGTQSYAGCYVNHNNFSIQAQRQGFPCGFYHIRVQHLDGGGELDIDLDGDGILEYALPLNFPYDFGGGPCNSGNKDFYLGTRSKVTIKAYNNSSSSFNAQVVFLYDPLKSKPPLVVNAGNDTAICIGASVNLGGTPTASGGAGAYSYAWSPAIFLNDPTLATPAATPAATTSYALTVVDTNNCRVTKNVKITVNPLPNVTVATNNAQVCTSDSLIFKASGAQTYTWSPNVGLDNVYTATPVFKAGYLFTFVGSYFVYTVVGEDANGCVNTAHDTVFINSLPTDTIYPVKDTLCTADAPITLTGFPNGAGDVYTIQPLGSFFVDTLKNALFDPSKYPDGTYVASHIYTDSKGCQNKPSIHLNVKTCVCTAQPVASLGADTIVCVGYPVPLRPIAANSSAYIWKTSGSGVFSAPNSLAGFYAPSAADYAAGSVVLTLYLPDPDGPRPCTDFTASRKISFTPKSFSSVAQTICQGDSFRMANKWYSTAGVFKDSVPSALTGCDSVITLVLKVSPTSSSAVPRTVCSGDSLRVGTHFYKTAGVYIDTFKNMAGCDSIVKTTVSISQTYTTFVYKNSCYAADTGLAQILLKSRDGCDSIILTQTVLLPKSAYAQTAAFCPGGSVKVGIHTYTSVGVYLDTLKNFAGCDSVITTTVAIFKPDTTQLFKASCLPSDTGLVKKILKNSNGCDSLVLTRTTLLSKTSSEQTLSFCAGDSVKVGPHIYRSAGVYSDTLKNATGCDSVITTTVSVFKTDTTQVFKTSCAPSDTGLIKKILKNVNGCDSLVLTRTTLLSKTSSAQTLSFCAGDSVKVGGRVYRSAGVYSDTLKNATGCDSVITTTVSVFKTDTTLIAKTSCAPSDTGLIKKILKNVNGCDSLVLTRTTLLSKTSSAQTLSFCAGDSTKVGSHVYRMAGIYSDTLKNATGCDSVITTTVSIFKTDTTLIAKTSCAPSDTGLVKRILKNSNGCDSLVLTRTTLLSKTSSEQTLSFCAGDSVKVGPHIYRSAGVYSDTLKNATGCDSVITTTVSIFKTDTTLIAKTSCAPSDTGLVKKILKNSNGCDSLVFTRTNLLSKTSSAQTVSFCAGDSTKVGSHVYRSAGVYSDTLKNGAGCDSVISTTVSVFKMDTTLIFKTSCAPSDTGLVKKILKSSNGCDSLVLTRTTLLSKTSSAQTLSFCAGDSVKVGGHVYRSAGVYSDTLKNGAGCDSIISTTVSFLKTDTTLIARTSCAPSDTGLAKKILKNLNGCDSVVLTRTILSAKNSSSITATVCAGDSARLFNRWYKTAGVFKDSVPGLGGCDSVVTLVLTVAQKVSASFAKTICAGDSVKVGGHVYRSAGAYSDTLKNLAGCDSVISTTVSIFKTDTTLVFKTSCAPSDTGLAKKILKNLNGCDSLVLTRTTLSTKNSSIVTATVCAGDSARLFGRWYKTAGVFKDSVPGLVGCDSVVTLVLTVAQKVSASFAKTICAGDSVKVGGHVYRSAGVYSDTLKNGAGCDSVISTTVSFLKTDTTLIARTSCAPSDTGLAKKILKNLNGCDSLVLTRTTLSTKNSSIVTATVCAGDSARLFGRWYKTAGVFKDSVPGLGGCDSVVTLVLTVAQKVSASFAKTICAGDSVKVGGHVYRSAGVYLDTLKNLAGCDSVISTTVSIFKTDTTLVFKTSCAMSDTGLVKKIFKNANGCDSLVLTRTTLSTKNSSIVTATVCAGDSARLFGRWYKTAGVFKDSVPGLGGCDSVVTLVLTVAQKVSASFAKTICAGDSVKVGGHVYRSAGVYLDTLKNLAGCDSVISTTVSFLKTDTTLIARTSCAPSDTGLAKKILKNLNGCDSLVLTRTILSAKNSSTIVATVCAGDSARLFNRWYKTAGVFKDSVPGLGGCDSVVTLVLTVTQKVSASFAKTICAGDSVKVGGHVYRSAGVYSDTLKNGAGCDSVISTTVSFLKTDTTLIARTSCAPSDTGLAKKILKNLNGCDSLVLTRTTLSTKNSSIVTATVCAGDSARLFGRWYKTAGVFKDSVPGLGGCDSVVTLVLTVAPKVSASFAKTICAGDSVKAGGHVYRSAGVYLDTLKNLAGCDSVISTAVSIFKTDTTLVFKTSCAMSDTGLVKKIFKNANGCDSLVLTRTTLSTKNSSIVTATVCAGDSARLFGRWYKTAGVFKDSVPGLGGCDSVVTLVLTVAQKVSASFAKTICAGDSVKVGGHVYRSAGVYSDTLKNGAGCDSVVSTAVSILKTDTTLIARTSCAPTDTGLAKKILKNLNGCDSLVLTRTTLSTKNSSTITATVCAGDSARLFNRWYKTAGVFKDSVPGAGGCDSVVTLVLTVAPKASANFTKMICAGDSVKVGGHVYRSAGAYLDTLKNFTGCDSVVSTTVSIFKTDTTQINKTSAVISDTGLVKTLYKNRNGCDSLVFIHTILFKQPAYTLAATICAGDSARLFNRWYKTTGVYNDSVRVGGMDSIVMLVLTVAPKVSASFTKMICAGDSVKVGGHVYRSAGIFLDTLKTVGGCDSAVTTTVVVLKPDTTYISKIACSELDTGLSKTVFKNRNGCDSLVWTQKTLGKKDATADLKEICRGDSLFFKNRWLYSSGIYKDVVPNAAGCDSAVELRLTVRPNDTTLIEKTSCRATEAGTKMSHLQNRFGCDSLVQIRTRYLSDGLKAVVKIVKPVRCFGAQDGALSASATAGGKPPYTFQWSVGASGDTAAALGPGIYFLTATDADGCDALDSVRLTRPEPLRAASSARPPACFGDSNGIVRIDSVKGGTAPYFLAFNSSAFKERITVLPFYVKYLKAGNYPVLITDARDCIFRDTADVTTRPPLFVDMGAREERLTLGDSVFLRPIAGFPIRDFQWNPPDYLSCPACLRGFAKPLFTTSYTLTLTDTAGCEAVGKITVFVDKPRRVFIPNAFSPNKDGWNDVLLVFAGQEVALVKTFQVFDRWGEKVFEANNAQPNDALEGWDGTFNGQNAPTGVYVYFARVVFKDGVEIVYQGDVNIIR